MNFRWNPTPRFSLRCWEKENGVIEPRDYKFSITNSSDHRPSTQATRHKTNETKRLSQYKLSPIRAAKTHIPWKVIISIDSADV